MAFKDPKTGILYPSEDWYRQKVNPDTGRLLSSERNEMKQPTSSVQQDATPEEMATGNVEIDQSGAPVLDETSGDIIASGEKIKGQTTTQIQQLQQTVDDLTSQLTDQQKEAEKEAKTYKSKLLDAITNRQDTKAEQKSTQEIQEEATKTALEQYGMTQEQVQQIGGLITEIDEYNRQIATLQSEKQSQLLNKEQQLQGYPGGIVRGEKALLERQYNSRISAKAAQAGVATQHLQMLQGAWQDVQTTADKIVNAATYDQQQELADIQWTIDTYGSLLKMASSTAKESWEKALNLSQQRLDEAKGEWQDKLNLMMSLGQNGIETGWDINYLKSHSIDELTKEYSEKLAGQKEVEKPGEPMVRTVGGNLYQYNPQTGEWGLAVEGGGDIFESGGLEISETHISQAQSELDSLRGSDGYTNSGRYLEFLQAWKADGGLEQDFYKKFPPRNYLNPNDKSIPQYIREKLKLKGDDIENPWR